MQQASATRRIGTWLHQSPFFWPASQCNQNTRSAAGGNACCHSHRSRQRGRMEKNLVRTSLVRGSDPYSIDITLPSPVQTICEKPRERGVLALTRRVRAPNLRTVRFRWLGALAPQSPEIEKAPQGAFSLWWGHFSTSKNAEGRTDRPSSPCCARPPGGGSGRRCSGRRRLSRVKPRPRPRRTAACRTVLSRVESAN